MNKKQHLVPRPITFLKNVIVSSLVFLLVPVGSNASTSVDSGATATVEYETNQQRKLQGLTWKSETLLKVEARLIGVDRDQTQLFVRLRGRFERASYSGTLGSTKVADANQLEFEYPVVLEEERQVILFRAIGPGGDVEVEKVVVSITGLEGLKKAAYNLPPKRLFYSVGLGLTSLAFQQDTLPDETSVVTTIKGSVNYLFRSNIETSASFYYNALTLQKSAESTGIRFWGFNARAGYVLHEAFSPWKVVLNGGWYYVTSFGSEFSGFENLSGPQVFPIVRYGLSEKEAVFGYVKYSPIANALKLLSLSNREIAIGGGYIFHWMDHQWSAGIDLSKIDLNIAGTKLSNRSLSLSLGLNF